MNMKSGFVVLFLSLKLFAGGFDLYETPSGKAARTLVFVHGGAWIGGDKLQYKPLGQRISERGFCAVIAGYSLAPKHRHPRPVLDLNNILKELSRKKSMNCDFGKLYLVGHSAGAHTISFWASKYRNANVHGFVGLEGIYDIPNIVKAFPDYTDWFINAEFGVKKNWEAASPTRLKLLQRSPWLVVQSKKDELVDGKQATDFKLSLEKQKIENEILWLEKDLHFEVVKKLEKEDSELLKKIAEFVLKN